MSPERSSTWNGHVSDCNSQPWFFLAGRLGEGCRRDCQEFVGFPQFFSSSGLLLGPGFTPEAPGVAIRVRPARPSLPRGNAGRSRPKIPAAPFPILFSHGPAVFCPRPRSPPTWSKEHLVRSTSSLILFLCLRDAV